MKFLNTFFLCITLESGAYIIAYLQILKSTIIFIVSSLELSRTEKPGEQIFDHYPFYLMASFLCVVHFMSSVLLIFGASRQKSNYILQWIIINSINLVVLARVIILLPADTTIFDNVKNNPALMIVKSVIAFVFAVYFWMCMLSLYMRIRETDSKPRDDSTSILNNIEGGIPHTNLQAV